MKLSKVVFVCVASLMLALVAIGCAPGPIDGTAGEAVDEAVGEAEQVVAEAEQTASVEELDGVSQATMDRYRISEVREYKGMRLDPAIGPRDNSIRGTQHVSMDKYTLEVTGLVDTPLEMTYEEVLEFDAHERLITLYCVEGWDATILWKGVRLMDLIEAAGLQDDVTTVIFKASDGYTTSLPLSVVIERDMLLAYQSNGIDLPPQMGYPFIVVAEDKLGYKWCRWVNEIELYDDENYLGYWEERGYSNSALVDESRR